MRFDRFTYGKFLDGFQGRSTKNSMDGKGRWLDNVCIERFWWTAKYGCVHLRGFETPPELHAGPERFINRYNNERIHSSRSYNKPPDLTPGDKLLIALQYYREYRTMEHIALDFCCAKSSVCRSIAWVEETLSADGRFQLPGKEALTASITGDSVRTIAVDVTAVQYFRPVQRPKKSRKTGIRARRSDTR